MPTNREKARELVARNTEHGLSRSEAKLNGKISSLRSEANYAQGIKSYFDWCELNGIHPDRHSNLSVMTTYLGERSELIEQTQLNVERRALEIVYRQRLPRVRSLQPTIFSRRSYTLSQINSIASHQSVKNSVPTLLAFHAGIRAHEAATILRIEERSPSSHRTWDKRRFLGFPEYRLYTVKGKGGLVRAIAVPLWLAEELDARKIPPKKVADRGIYYVTHFDIGFGQAWSQSFSDASKRALGYSTGGHGARHSYAKKRLYELIKVLELLSSTTDQTHVNQQALFILSQELGHFRLDISFSYLR